MTRKVFHAWCVSCDMEFDSLDDWSWHSLYHREFDRPKKRSVWRRFREWMGL